MAWKGTRWVIDGRTTWHAGYSVSLKVRTPTEEIFGWLKTLGGLRRTGLIGQAKLAGQALVCFASCKFGTLK